ncbi:MAG TPA: ABC transporter permease subunit [Solirubrobacteraceae bacterium]|nr:ABC transporter permease subunit [Solirubrobacteraceae bacterium]
MSATSAGVLCRDAASSRISSALGPAWALVRRALRDARTRTIAFAYLFALYAYIQPVGYRSAYPTLTDRLGFVHSFAGNDAIRLFYGYPYDPLTVGGYCAWRVGGTLAIAAAVFGVLAAVRALRTEEEAGRSELVLGAPVGRTTALAAALCAIATGVALLWAAAFGGFLVGGLPAGGSAYLALSIASVVPVFVGVGALTSQLAPTRRLALELGTASVGLALLLRVIADTASGAGWLRWATPLGWAEEMRPFTGAQPLVLLLPAATSVGLCVLAARIAARRDIGTGMLPARDTAAAHLRLLSSTSAQALRAERGSLGVWLGSVGVFALVFGVVSKSVSTAGISEATQREIAKLGSGSITTPSGYVSFVFIFVILVVSLFACAQINVARHEEAEGRLETLLSLPVSRGSWLAGRLVIAALGASSIALVAALLAWAGAASQGAAISLSSMLEAGANCLPVALFFLGFAALAYALLPRACVGIAYGLVTVTFLWQLVGSLLGAPKWLVELTPFAHVGLVPAQPFKAADAVVMLAIALGACAFASWAFTRRDLIGE